MAFERRSRPAHRATSSPRLKAWSGVSRRRLACEAGHPVHHRIARSGTAWGVAVGLAGWSSALRSRRYPVISDVRDQQVGLEFLVLVDRFLAAVAPECPTLVVQGHLDQIGQRRLVVDEQDADRRYPSLPVDSWAAGRGRLPRIPGAGRRGTGPTIMNLL